MEHELDLSSAPAVAAGAERLLYRHPLDPSRCVKVPKHASGRQQGREERYFERLAARRIPWRHMPEFFGTVATNRGRGLVFEYVQDFDGNRSSDLRSHVRRHGPRGVAEALRDLEDHYARWAVITCDMSFDNFLVRRSSPDAIEILMIDGLGNREFIPVSSLFRSLARRKMARRWRAFHRKLEAELGITARPRP